MSEADISRSWFSSAEEAFRHAVVQQEKKSIWPSLLHMACRFTRAVASQGDASQGDELVAPPAVLCGFVLSRETAPGERCYACVSLGSGTRCKGVTVTEDDAAAAAALFRIHDGHAEAMARKGFLAFLLQEADQVLSNDMESAFIQVVRDEQHAELVLRGEYKVHAVCTQWPCGSLALAETGQTGGHVLLGTPVATLDIPFAHTREPHDSFCVRGNTIATHHSSLDMAVQLSHCTRVKPGKGPPNVCMSCSDKVWKWSLLGVQGSLCRLLYPRPIYLDSLHVAVAGNLHISVNDASAPAEAILRTRAQLLAQKDSTLPLLHIRRFPLSYLEESCTHSVHSLPNDSTFSRVCWRTTKRCENSALPRKRPRLQEEAADCVWRWATTVTCNMKAGYPQGLSEKAFRLFLSSPSRQLCAAQALVFHHSVEQCASLPLCKAWLATKVLQLLLSLSPRHPIFSTLTEEVPMNEGEGKTTAQFLRWIFLSVQNYIRRERSSMPSDHKTSSFSSMNRFIRCCDASQQILWAVK